MRLELRLSCSVVRRACKLVQLERRKSSERLLAPADETFSFYEEHCVINAHVVINVFLPEIPAAQIWILPEGSIA